MTSQVNSSLDDVQADLGPKTGYRIEVPLTYAFTNSLRGVFSPWFEYSAIGQSNFAILTSGGAPIKNGDGQEFGVREPDSRTFQYGGLLGVSTDI